MTVRLLVVDDDPDLRGMLELGFRLVGYEVETASNGAEALAAASERPPDVLLTDLNMPVLDGLGLCTAVRRHPELEGLPIVVFTAMTEDPRLTTLEGMDAIVVGKHCRFEELRRTVHLACAPLTPSCAGAATRPSS